MERTDILELMSTLKLYGMRAAYDEVMTTGIKRRHETPRIVGDLLSAEIAEKQARSISSPIASPKDAAVCWTAEDVVLEIYLLPEGARE